VNPAVNYGRLNLRKEINVSRREALKRIFLVSAGASVVLLGASEILGHVSNAKSAPRVQSSETSTVNLGDSSVSTAATSSTILQTSASTFSTIKAVYFGMSVQMTGTKEEYFSLNDPVFLQDLISQIKQKHAVFATMLPTIQVVVNGEPTQDNPQLSDKAEVEFIPVYAGG